MYLARNLVAAGRMGFALALAIAVAGAGGARAGSLELIVTESGGPAIIIADGSVFDTNGATGAITVDVTLLNGLLTNYQFGDLGALSNATSATDTASLSQTGTVELLTGGTGTISIVATDTDWNSPSGATANLNSSATANFTHGNAGDNQTGQSWYNPSNSLAGMENPTSLLSFTSTGPNPNGGGDNSPTAMYPSTIPFGLTNQAIINLSGGTPSALSKDQFSVSTTLTASAIPEPTSVALMGIALPLVVVGLRNWRRRSA